MTQIGFVEMRMPLSSPYYTTDGYIADFVRVQLLSCAAELDAPYAELHIQCNSTSAPIFQKRRGIYVFDITHAKTWRTQNAASPQAFFLWLLIECLVAVRSSLTLEWTLENHRCISHLNLLGVCDGECIAILREGNSDVIKEWRNIPDGQTSGIMLLQALDGWTLTFLLRWIMEGDSRWISQPKALLALVKDPINTARAMIAPPSRMRASLRRAPCH